MIVMVPASWAAVKSIHAQLSDEEKQRLRDQYGGGAGGTTTGPDPYAQPVPTLFNITNRWYYDPDRQLIGRLETYYTGAGANRKQKYRLVSEDGTRRIPITKGSRLLDPQSARLFSVADMYETGNGARDFQLSAQAVTQDQWDRFFPPGTALGAEKRDYAGEAAQAHGYDVELERMKEAFQAEQGRLDAERAMELQRLQEENAMKRARLGEAGSLARTAAEVQQRARQWIAKNQGVDPIRAFIGGQGMAQRGRTPAQQFTTQLEGIASAPIPTVSENASIPEIEQTIQALQGQQQAPVQPSLGFAAGGTIDMTRNDAGTFEMSAPTAQMGTTKRAILVGEEGGFTGDEEVVIIDSAQPGRTEVIPLMAGAAEGGMFDASTVYQTLAPIYKRLGLAGVGAKSPTGQGYALSPFGRRTTGGGNEVLGGSQYLSALGYRPNLIRDVSSGNTYYRGADNQLHHLSPEAWNQAQFQIGDVLNVAPNELSQFGGFGAPQTAAPDMAEQAYQRYPQRSIPLSVPQPGGADIPLPDIRSIAGIWRYLDPETQGLLGSFYGTAGLGGLPGSTANPAQAALIQIQELVKALSPAGTGRAASAHF